MAKARANKSKNKSESRKAATCLLYAAGNGAGGCATEACEWGWGLRNRGLRTPTGPEGSIGK